MTRICLVGHSGAGKSTTAAMIGETARSRHLSCEVVKVGTPLYELQDEFYTRLGSPLPRGQQDQQLLEAMAGWVRERRPRFLVEDFLRRAGRMTADVLVNDDVRSYELDYLELRRHGWIAVRIRAPEQIRVQRLDALHYLSRTDTSTAGVEAIDVDHEIVNDAGYEALRARVEALMNRLFPC